MNLIVRRLRMLTLSKVADNSIAAESVGALIAHLVVSD
jgi:hypothetical protein